MVAGGVDDGGAAAGADFEVVQVVVVVDEHGGDGLGFVLSGPGVGGQDFLPGLQGADGLFLAVREQHLGLGGETLPADSAAARLVLTGLFGVFPGGLGSSSLP